MVSQLNRYLVSDLVPEYIDTKLIDPSPWNARDQLGLVDSLMDSIRINGLLQPIVVRILKQRFQIVAGNRRFKACKKLHWVKIPCVVRELSDKQAYEIGLVENIERKTLTPVEEAKAFHKYVQENEWGSVSELARAIGRSKEYVSHRISLLRLPDDVLELISTDKIAPSTAGELTTMDNPQSQKALAKALSNTKVSTVKVREAVKMYREGLEMSTILNMVGGKEGSAHQVKQQGRLASNRKYIRLLDKCILAIRICMVRLDSILEELDSEESDNLKQLLIQKRLQIHNQIDELMQLKRQSLATMDL